MMTASTFPGGREGGGKGGRKFCYSFEGREGGRERGREGVPVPAMAARSSVHHLLPRQLTLTVM